MVELSLAEAATKYALHGLYVFPIGAGRKEPLGGSRGHLDATIDCGALHEVWTDNPNFNIAMSTGPSGLLVVDVDPRNGGDESWSRLSEELGIVDATPAVRTGGGGSHYYFRLPTGSAVSSKSNAFGNDYPGVDVKASGGYVVVPPSLHPNGNQYEAVGEYPPTVLPIAPATLLDRLSSPKSVSAEQEVQVLEGQRTSFLLKHAGHFRNQGMSLIEMTSALNVLNESRCAPRLPLNEVCKIAKSIYGKAIHPIRNGGALTIQCLSSIEPEAVAWLWKDRIPYGKITLFAGDPSAGKSYATIAIASAVSRGLPLPGEFGPNRPADVLIASYEDGVADTIRPRADLCGADVSRIHHIEGPHDANGNPTLFSLADIPRLELELDRRPEVKLLVIDPIGALLANTDSHRDSNLRAAMAPLAALANRTGVPVVVVLHLNKDEEKKAMYRVGGSIGFVGLARSVLMFGVDESSSRRACIQKKSNLGQLADTIEYAIDNLGFHWIGISPDLTEQKLFGLRQRGPSGVDQNDEADAFLSDFLSSGEAACNDIYAEADELGISKRRITNARIRMRIVKRKDGLSGGWYWSLPGRSDGNGGA